MSKKRLRRLATRLLPVVLVTSAVCAVLLLHGLFFLSVSGQRLELRQTDLWFRLRGARPVPEDIVIVSIDESTYRELSLSTLAPLPRGLVAQLVDRLAQAGASLVIIDLFFRDPGNDPAGNDNLARAISTVPTFIGAFQYEEATANGGEKQSVEVSPIAQFAARAEKVVLMNIRGLDIVRFFRLPRPDRDKNETLAAAYAARSPVKELPQAFDLISFYGPPGSMRRVSAHNVLRTNPAQNESNFRGKTVLIGNALEAKTGFAVKDSFLTPAHPMVMPGVEIHATALGNIKNKSWIRRMDSIVELALTSFFLAVATLAVIVLTPVKGALFALLLNGIWASVAYVGFLGGVFIPGVLMCLVILPLTVICTTLAKHRLLRKRFSQIQEMLGLVE